MMLLYARVCSQWNRPPQANQSGDEKNVNIDQCDFTGKALAAHYIYIDKGYKSYIQLANCLK